MYSFSSSYHFNLLDATDRVGGTALSGFHEVRSELFKVVGLSYKLILAIWHSLSMAIDYE